MGAFEFVALDQSGKQAKGLLEGDTPKHVRQLLRDRNLFPVSVTEVAQKEARRQRSFSFRRGMSPGELALITRQLASLSQSGLPIEEALEWGLFVSNAVKETEPAQFTEPGIFAIAPDRTLYASMIQTMPFARPPARNLLSFLVYVSENDYPARGEAATVPATPS